MVENRYMTAQQAAASLGVSVGTLYSYVSRGMLRSEPVAGKPRVRRYLAEDVARMVERKELRRNPGRAAAKGLHWGSPVLESSLTLIHEGRLYYRGRDAIELAGHATVEEVAALLWTGDSSEAESIFSRKSLELPAKLFAVVQRVPNLGPIERCQLALPVAGTLDAAAYDLRPAAVAKTGAGILRVLLSAVCGCSQPGAIDQALARSLARGRKSFPSAIRAALVVCADHELNVSAFTARCIASARGTPYEVVNGALAAFRGRRHGGASEQIEDLFREGGDTSQVAKVLGRRLRVYGGVPGFGHPLYPDGDPRASLLISLARTYGRASVVDLADRLARAAQSMTGQAPNLDFGLVTLSSALQFPAGTSMTLFAIGRTVGWIAHAIEQYADEQLIRPRARYMGPAPLRQ